MCHRGQGAATTVEAAHSSTLAWEEPVLPARYFESSCGQCHQNSLIGTPQLNLGRKLLAQYGCVSCHIVKTPGGARMTATDEPPPLSAHRREDLRASGSMRGSKNPQAYSASVDDAEVQTERCGRRGHFRVSHRPEHHPGSICGYLERGRTVAYRCDRKARAFTANRSARRAMRYRMPQG